MAKKKKKVVDFRHKYSFGNPFSDATNNQANKSQYIEFYHILSGKSVRFKAFVTQFEDQFSSNWNSEEVYGRMDPILTFQRTGRVIQMTFDVPASSVDESVGNLRRLTSLIQMLYPSYETGGNASTIKGSPMVKVSFMNWISNGLSTQGGTGTAEESGVLGALAGVNFVPDMEQGVMFQEIQGQPIYDEIYPKVFRVSFQLTVVHEQGLGWSGKGGAAKLRRNFRSFPYGATGRYLDEGYVKPPPPPPSRVGPPVNDGLMIDPTAPRDGNGNPIESANGEPTRRKPLSTTGRFVQRSDLAQIVNTTDYTPGSQGEQPTTSNRGATADDYEVQDIDIPLNGGGDISLRPKDGGNSGQAPVTYTHLFPKSPTDKDKAKKRAASSLSPGSGPWGK
jgi:hypothetical protein